MLAASPLSPATITSSSSKKSSSPLRSISASSSTSSSSSSRNSHLRANSSSTSPTRTSSSGSRTTPSLSPETKINPLYSLGERIDHGELAGVHVFSAKQGDVDIRQTQGEQLSLVHPSTWFEHTSHSSESGRKGKGVEMTLDSFEGPGKGEEETVKDFRDHGIEHSRRDQVRMAAHEWKAEVKEEINGSRDKGKGKVLVDPVVENELARVESRNSSLGNASLSSPPQPNGIPTAPPRVASPVEDLGIMVNTPPRTSSRVPILNAPGLQVTNSRTIASPSLDSPNARVIPVASLTKPLPPLTNPNSTLSPPSSTASSRRATTSGSRPSHSSAPHFPLAKRVNSYPHPSTSLPDSIAGISSIGPIDEVQSSILAQEDLIRKERQNKRLELAKERQEGEEGRVGGRKMGSMSSLKRRSTRAGSETGVPGGGVLMGNLIGQDHANYVLMYNMLTGIRIAVSRCQAKLKRPLTDADYTARHKFSFDIVGNELTPSTKYDFKFKDYAPWVFRELREYFYLDPSDYLVSLTAKYILSELGSPGKSGSFFYFSRDYRFIIKTIRHSEHKFLRSILKEYHEYIKKNPHTLLSRFYGLHRVKLPRGRKIHFVIMNNLFPPHRDIHETYDLKGSSIGRIYPEEKALNNPGAILKDLNWLNRDRHLALGPEKKALFEEQLRRDTELMQKLGIMDYSLLTGIHNVVRGNVDNLRDGMLTVFQPDEVKVRRKPTQIKRDADASALRKAVQRSDPKPLEDANKLPDADLSERRLFLFYQDEGGIRATGDNNEDLGVIYYLGIIDILTPYTLIKKLEHFFRALKHDGRMISAIPPVDYGNRFLSFIKSVIVGNDESLRPPMWTPPPVITEMDEEGKVKVKVE